MASMVGSSSSASWLPQTVGMFSLRATSHAALPCMLGTAFCVAMWAVDSTPRRTGVGPVMCDRPLHPNHVMNPGKLR